jgi:hypothetical protein
VIIPQSLRTPAATSSSGIPSYSIGGLDLNAMVGGAMRLPEVLSMAESGRVDEAAQLYSQITGLSHEDAVRSVQTMAAGQAVSIVPTPGARMWQPAQSFSPTAASQTSDTSFNNNAAASEFKTTNRGCGGIVIAIVVLGILLAIGIGVGAIFFFSNGQSSGNPLSSVLPAGFANKTLTFGSEGIGPGMFTDPRAIALDGDGNILVADYQDGRVQTFDPTGKFISSFSLGAKQIIPALAVGRDGKIYVVNEGKIKVYDKSGSPLSVIGDINHIYMDITSGAGGTLFAVANDDTIVRFKPDGNIDLEVKDTFQNVTGNSESDARLAVDGLGNMYLLGGNNYLVLKFSPEGKYINQFGGQSKDDSTFSPGKFIAVDDIAVDGYGRVYVSDFGTIQVFDSTGAYVISFSPQGGVPFGMVFDLQNNLYTATNGKSVERFQIQKPAGQ